MDDKSVLQNLKLLYVEDEDFTRKQMAKLLKRQVGKLITAENGAHGLDLFDLHKPDIVIADLIMPVMGGLELIKEIRKRDSSCFIIITTAIGDTDSILKTVDVGIDKYLIKPLNADDLNAALEDITLKAVKRGGTQVAFESAQKKEYELSIRKKFSHMLKKSTGKGPVDVSVFISGNTIEIKAFEVLTSLEKSLMENRTNIKYVEMNRKLYYSIQQNNIESLISEVLGRKVEISGMVPNAQLDLDNLSLTIN